MKYYTISSCLDCKLYRPGYVHGHCRKSKKDISFIEAKVISAWCELPDLEE